MTVTVRCDLFIEFLSHVDDASCVKITIGAGTFKQLKSMVSVWLRRCPWRCLTSNSPMYLFLSMFLLDVNVKSERATASGGVLTASSHSSLAPCCAAIPGLHSLLRMFCSRLDLTVLGFFFWASPSTHTSRLSAVSVLWRFRCTTRITLSSISSVC